MPSSTTSSGQLLSVVEADLLQDPETAAIAKELGMAVPDYVKMVMEYVKDPAKEPQLEVYEDYQLAQLDDPPATVREIQTWLKKVESGEVNLGPHEFKSQFSKTGADLELKARRFAGDTPTMAAPKPGEAKAEVMADDTEAGRSLKEQLQREAEMVRRRKL